MITLNQKFGYDAMVEKEAIRRRLIDSGVTDKIVLHFAVEDAYLPAHAKTGKFRHKSITQSAASVGFTAEELERIAERFEGANDPLSISIYAKARTDK